MDKAAAFPSPCGGFRVHLVGIKGTGMTALAEILSARGARVTGSDTAETFYTDAILRGSASPSARASTRRTSRPTSQLVVHSAAYRSG